MDMFSSNSVARKAAAVITCSAYSSQDSEVRARPPLQGQIKSTNTAVLEGFAFSILCRKKKVWVSNTELNKEYTNFQSSAFDTFM